MMQAGRNNRQRSRSPRSNSYDARRRDRSIEHDGPRNRDKYREPPREVRLNYDGKHKHRGRRARRGSASSSNSDKPLYRQELENSMRKQTDSRTSATLVVDPTPLAETDWTVEITELQRVLGITGFNSTKETKVPGNDRLYGVHKTKKTQYRQYMNRVGGFNRPLSPTRGNQFAKHADTSGIQS